MKHFIGNEVDEFPNPKPKLKFADVSLKLVPLKFIMTGIGSSH